MIGTGPAVRVRSTVLALAALGLAACTAAGFLGGLWWGADLLASFRMHYLVCLAVVAGLAAGLEHRRIAAVGCVAFAVNLAVVAPLYLPGAPRAAADAPRLHVLAFNVLGSNRELDAIADYIAAEDPDVVIVTELEPGLADTLRARLTGYRFAAQPQRDNFGIGILTREPWSGFVVRADGHPARPAVGATVALGDRGVYVVGVHPPPPVGAALARERDALIERIGDWAREARDPLIVCGDFNATPWSYPMRRLRARTGLHDASRGRGPLPTWPRHLGWAGIPIDHCLHSDALAVVERRVGPWLGSDHRPLHVVFAPAR